MASESALERILRVLEESEQIDSSLKPALEQGIRLLEASPTVPGFQAIVEKSVTE